MPKRFDVGELRKPTKTSEGFLQADALVTRIGVFEYARQDGTIRRELRPPEEVFKNDSLNTLAQKPVTLNHPQQKVTPATFKDVSVGVVGSSVERFDKYVRSSVTIYAEDAISAVESGKEELSCGYDVRLDETPGVWNGEPYDVVQRDISYNHVAIVDAGRAGPEVRLRLDEQDAIMRRDRVTGSRDLPFAGRTVQWDAVAAEKRVRMWAKATDGPNAKYRSAFMWFDPDQEKTFGGYKLQIVDIIDGEPKIVPRAVFAVAGVLRGARGGVKVPEADIQKLRGAVSSLYARMRSAFDDDTIRVPWDRGDTQKGRDKMPKVNVDGVEYTVEDGALAQKIVGILSERDDARKTVETLEMSKVEIAGKHDALVKERDELQGKHDALQAEKEKLEKERADSKQTDQQRLDWYNERQTLLRLATTFKVDKAETLDNSELKVAIVKAHNPQLNLDNASDGYIDGAFNVIRNLKADAETHLDNLAKSTVAKTDSKQTEPREDFDKQFKDAEVEYNKGLTSCSGWTK